jgi:hypothetical protein
MSDFITSTEIGNDERQPFTENQVKRRVKDWQIPYTCSNGKYLFKKSDWDRAIEEKALRTAASRAASKKRKTTHKKSGGSKSASSPKSVPKAS